MTMLRDLAVGAVAGATMHYLITHRAVLLAVAAVFVVVYLGGWWYAEQERRSR